jgi:hypothetical protein
MTSMKICNTLRESTIRIQDTLTQWHHSGLFGTRGLYWKTGGIGATAKIESHAFPVTDVEIKTGFRLWRLKASS